MNLDNGPTQEEVDEVARLIGVERYDVAAVQNEYAAIETHDEGTMPESIRSDHKLEAAQKYIAWAMNRTLAA